jgi:hypothetical protein
MLPVLPMSSEPGDQGPGSTPRRRRTGRISSDPPPGSRRLHRGLRLARRGVWVLAAIALGLLVRRIGIVTLDERNHSLDGVVRPGATLVLVDLGPHTVLGAGSLIEAELFVREDGQRMGILSQVAAGPGQVVDLVESEDGGFLIVIDGRHTPYRISIPGVLAPGTIPPDSYLVLNPSPEVEPMDSRRFGLITRDRIRRKIVAHF